MITPKIFRSHLIQKCKQSQKKIVLPEGEEERILKASHLFISQGLGKLILLGDPSNIKNKLFELSIKLDENQVEIINPKDTSYYKNFYESLKKYTSVDEIKISLEEDFKKLEGYDKIFVGIHPGDDLRFNKTYKFSDLDKKLLAYTSSKHSLILNLFCNPYSLLNFDFNSVKTIIISYENTPEAQMLTSEIIFGKRKALGKLPIKLELKNF